ncbi:MAG: peptidyl-prolyl cis-trans isomerase [Planctomycetota bacterium]|nr:peptidyl-prolyl cis-trans isomerase [Planctomycetota bacterium]
MNAHERPNLELGIPPGKLNRLASGVGRKWFILLAILQVLTLACLLALLPRRGGENTLASVAGPPREDLRAVAIELENKSLPGEAARAWEKYLAAAPDEQDRAEILYRIGKLHLQAEEFAPAVTAFVRAEQYAGKETDLRGKIGPLMIDCLRRLGLYGEVGRELSRRVEAGAEQIGKGKVLATVAGEEIGEADLDRLIERRVDQMLAMQGAGGDAATRQALLKQLGQPETRQRLLQELLQRELFTRRARELKFDREEAYLQSRRALEEELLAKLFQDRELGKIEPTEVDLEASYKTHTDRYQQPETLEAVTIRLADDEDPAKLLQEIKSAEDFQRLAAKRAGGAEQDAPPKAPLQTLVRGRTDGQLGTIEPLFALEAGRWTDKPLVHGQARYLVLVAKKTPASTLPFSQVRGQVEAEYRQRKQQELAQKLFQDLMNRYDVKWLSAPDSGEDPSPTKK